MVSGASGVVNYGELSPIVKVGDSIEAGQLVGMILQVLREDTARDFVREGGSFSMLHLELYESGIKEPVEWTTSGDQPEGLRDPTEFLKAALVLLGTV
jgi:hypothetical protein